MALITVAATIAVAVADPLLKLHKKAPVRFGTGAVFLLLLLFYSCVFAVHDVVFNINNSVAAVCQSTGVKEIYSVHLFANRAVGVTEKRNIRFARRCRGKVIAQARFYSEGVPVAHKNIFAAEFYKEVSGKSLLQSQLPATQARFNFEPK